MIPDTITIPIADIVRFVLIVGPAFFLGWVFGIWTHVAQVRQTGYRVVWKRVGLRSWPTMEKVKNEQNA